MPLPRRSPRARHALVGLLLSTASVAAAHGPPAALELWGGFPADTARCQRAVSRATALCIGQVVAAHAACLGEAIAGGACDDAALGATTAAVHQQALDRVQRDCSEQQVQALGFLDRQDALTDVGDACRALDDAATSAAFGPALVAGSAIRVAAPVATCIQATAREVVRTARFAVGVYQKALDRVATVALDGREKTRLIEWAGRRIALARAHSGEALTSGCDAADFTVAYRRPPDALLAAVGAQAMCMAELVYVQDRVLCPAPVCGNGIQERGEACDDANAIDGDGCHHDCTADECDAFPSTFDLIQRAIFERPGCTNDACHGNAHAGGLDLRAGSSYADSVGVAANINPTYVRIKPGDAEHSLLFLKLAAKTLPAQYPSDDLGVGNPMPAGAGPGLSTDELDGLRRWIDAGAPPTGAVPGVATVLHSCALAAQPSDR